MTKQMLIPPFPRLSGRLYIFPALIPMAEILPWLLTAVGALASASSATFWSQRRNKVMAVATLCFFAAGCLFAWNEYRKPSAEEGARMVASADLPKLTAANTAVAFTEKTYESFAPLWTVAIKREALATPVVSGDLLLLGTFEGALDAYARTDGKLAWSLQKKEPIFTNIAISGDKGFVGEGLHTAPSATLTALSLPDGKPLWSRQFRSHVESETTLDPAHHSLWTCAGELGVWALDMENGDVIWHKPVGHTDATPLLDDGHLYISAQPDDTKIGAELSSLDPYDGETAWKTALPGNTMGSPRMGGAGVILLTTAVGQVGPQKADDKGWSHAVDAKGKILWSVELPGMPLPEAIVLAVQGLVIHTMKNGDMIALHITDGSRAWYVKQGKEFLAPAGLRDHSNPPLLAGITSDGLMVIRNAEDGTEIRSVKLKQGGYAAPVFAGDVLYLAAPHEITAYGGVHLLTRGDK